MAEQATVAGGWFPDPTARHEQRYWDGTRWCEHVADAGRVSSDPLDTRSPVMPFEAVEFADIAVRLDPAAARDVVVREFGARGFRVSFLDAWNAVAERGKKGMNVALGAFAQYYCVGVTVFTGAQGETVIRLLRAPTGYWTGGGIIGKARVSGAFADITNELVAAFTEQGVLAGVQHA
jgi:hypothetical protein